MNNRPLIWIIDDDDCVRDAAAMLFESYGWQVQTCDSGEVFLAIINTTCAPACVLLDIDLPDMNGLDVISALTRIHPSTPITILTGRRRDSLEAIPAYRQINAVLSKPIDAAQLLKAIPAVSI